MSSFYNSIVSVVIILILTGAGYYCGYRGYIDEAGKGMLSKILLRLCIPCMILTNFQTNFTRDSLQDAGRGVLASFIVLISLILLTIPFMKILKLPRRQRGVFLMLAGESNAIFIGYPICLELFGESCVKYVMMFYLAGTVSIQLFGSGAVRISGGSGKLFSLETVKKLLTTPAILTIFISALLLLFDVRLPGFVLSVAKYLNGCVTPLALLVTGYIIYSIGLKCLRFDKIITVAMILRFIVSPFVALLVCKIVGVSGLLRSVIVLESSMPSPSQTVVFASEFGADDVLAARGCSISTLLSFVMIPIFMLGLNAL